MSIVLPPVRRGEAFGMRWELTVGGLLASMNGYVQLSKRHPWFGASYDDIEVRVHGGLTYGCDTDGWIGFDTAHYGDYWSDAEILRFGGDPNRALFRWKPLGEFAIDWTIEMVEAETVSLARQAWDALTGLDKLTISGGH